MMTLADLVLSLSEPMRFNQEPIPSVAAHIDVIAWTNEDATQTGLAGQQGYDDRVVAPEQVKLTELAKAS